MDVLREVLTDAPGIEGAFVYGSTVRGDNHTGSDVDLFLILDPESNSARYRRQLSDAELLIGRPLDVIEYTAATARERTRSGMPFLERVLAEPKACLRGDAEILSRMVAAPSLAAGLFPLVVPE